jgi:hypothetical protein
VPLAQQSALIHQTISLDRYAGIAVSKYTFESVAAWRSIRNSLAWPFSANRTVIIIPGRISYALKGVPYLEVNHPTIVPMLTP